MFFRHSGNEKRTTVQSKKERQNKRKDFNFEKYYILIFIIIPKAIKGKGQKSKGKKQRKKKSRKI